MISSYFIYFDKAKILFLQKQPTSHSTELMLNILNKHLKYFINGKNVRSYSSKGTATPDHVIRVKPFPLVITPKKNSSIKEFKTTAKKAFENYRKNTSIIYWITSYGRYGRKRS